MELIGIEMSAFTRRSRSLALRHADLALDRSLEHGERVVLWDALSGDYHSGTVVDVDGVDGNRHYRFEVGIRLPEDMALDRITGMPTTSTRLSNQDVVDLLEQLRGTAPSTGRLHGHA